MKKQQYMILALGIVDTDTILEFSNDIVQATNRANELSKNIDIDFQCVSIHNEFTNEQIYYQE